jgi:gag-polyprotein putative aspartyl protease
MKLVERVVGRLRRPTADPRLAAARAAHAAGDFVEARRLAVPLVEHGATLEAMRGLAELEYLLGDSGAAEDLLRRVVEESGRDVDARVDAEVALALVYFQTNRYAEANGLFAGLEDAVVLPIWELMRSFGDEPPYRIDSLGDGAVTLPFMQTSDWELPCVAIEIDGRQVDARIDTGGELLTLSRDVAEAVGVDLVVTATGVFAGGAQGDMSYGRVEAVSVGGTTVRGVPVAVVDLDRPVIGTGFLRQFLPTIDYPNGRLVLRPRTDQALAGLEAELSGAHAVEVPFALAASHLIVARGSLDAEAPLTFTLDSGLQDEQGAAFAAPPATLAAAGIPIPETIEDVRESARAMSRSRSAVSPSANSASGLSSSTTSSVSTAFSRTSGAKQPASRSTAWSATASCAGTRGRSTSTR